MADTTSVNRGYALQQTGNNPGTWGVILNGDVFSIIDNNLGGTLSKAVDGSSDINLSSTEAENLNYSLTGILTGNINVIWPSGAGFYILTNNTTGPFTLTVKPTGGTGFVLAQDGNPYLVFVSSVTGIAFIVANNTSLAIPVPIADGGTDATTATGALTNLGAAGLATSNTFTAANDFTDGSIVVTTQAAADSSTKAASTAFVNSTALTLAPGTTAVTQTVGDTSTNIATDAFVTSSLVGIRGSFKNLAIAWASNTAINFSADQVLVQNSSGVPYVTGINSSIATGTSGAGGIDTGSIAPNTWYYLYVIVTADRMTVMGIFSLSSTAPTLPGGYSFYARIGAFFTDGSSHVIGFMQKGRKATYTLGNNLSSLPVMASGTAGNVTIPTWVSIGVGSFVPATASQIIISPYGSTSGANQQVIVAPNGSYSHPGATGAAPISLVGSVGAIQELLLESTNIYWASGNVNNYILAVGWEDNL